MSEKKRNVRVRTPKVTFQYAHLSRKDQKYDRYSVSCTEKEEVLDGVVERIEEFIGDTFPPKAVKHKAFRRGYERKDDGTITLKASTKFGFECVDLRGNEMIAGDKRIASGTTGKLNLELIPSIEGDKPGVTLRLVGVQVINLKSYASGGFGDASDELGEDEEGYVASDDDVAEAKRLREERRAKRGDPAASAAEKGDTSDDAADGSAEDF